MEEFLGPRSPSPREGRNPFDTASAPSTEPIPRIRNNPNGLSSGLEKAIKEYGANWDVFYAKNSIRNLPVSSLDYLSEFFNAGVSNGDLTNTPSKEYSSTKSSIFDENGFLVSRNGVPVPSTETPRYNLKYIIIGNSIPDQEIDDFYKEAYSVFFNDGSEEPKVLRDERKKLMQSRYQIPGTYLFGVKSQDTLIGACMGYINASTKTATIKNIIIYPLMTSNHRDEMYIYPGFVDFVQKRLLGFPRKSRDYKLVVEYAFEADADRIGTRDMYEYSLQAEKGDKTVSYPTKCNDGERRLYYLIVTEAQ